MSEQKLFLRKATGLVREIGFFTAMLIIICHVVGLGWQKRVFQVSGWAPSPPSEYFLGIHPMSMSFLLVGLLVILPTLYCVAVMSSAMPRSGGGYVFISRILHPGLGFVGGWLAMLSTAVSYGLIGVAGFEALGIFGSLMGPGFNDWINANVLQPVPMFIGGIVLIAIFSAIASMGVQQWGRLLQVMFWIPAVLLVFVYFLFLVASPAAMAQGVQVLYGADPVAYTKAALEQGMASAAKPYWTAVGTATIASIWAFGGYYAASFVAGEVKEASRNMSKILFAAGIAIVLVYATNSLLLGRAGGLVGQEQGWTFINAVAYLRHGGGDFAQANLTPVGAWMTNFAGIQAAGMGLGVPGIGGFLLLLFGTLWVLNDIPPFILVTSRTVFAMAFDRVMPEKFAEISERWHSPVYAVWFVSAIAVLGAAAEADVLKGLKGGPLGFLFTIINSGGLLTATDIWSTFFEVFLVLSAVLFPLRKAEIFERSPWRQSKNVVMGVGAFATLAQLVTFWVLVTDPHGYNLLNIKSLPDAYPMLFSILLALIGLGIYLYYTNKSKVTGVQLQTIFAEIPPE